jgi:hypothetical protein
MTKDNLTEVFFLILNLNLFGLDLLKQNIGDTVEIYFHTFCLLITFFQFLLSLNANFRQQRNVFIFFEKRELVFHRHH